MTSFLDVIRCPFREAGCEITLPEDMMYCHADSCKYGRYLCPYNGPFFCYFEGNKQNLLDHLSRFHKHDKSFVVSPFPRKLKMTNYPRRKNIFQTIQSGDNLFFWVGRNEENDGISYFAVQYIGPLTWCDRFRYSITLRSADDKQALTEYKNTTGYQQSPYEVMLMGESVMFYNSYINLCLDSHKTLSMELNVLFLGLDPKPDF